MLFFVYNYSFHVNLFLIIIMNMPVINYAATLEKLLDYKNNCSAHAWLLRDHVTVSMKTCSERIGSRIRNPRNTKRLKRTIYIPVPAAGEVRRGEK